VPPHVGGQLAARRLLGRDERGRHVRLAVDLVRVEPVAPGVLHVDEDRVVLGRPAALGAAPVVVGPDDLVEEAVAAEHRVEEHLRVVRLPVVQVQVEGPGVRQQTPGLLEAGLQEVPVVLEGVVVPEHRAADRLVAASSEAQPRPSLGDARRHGATLLRHPRVEGRVDVDQLEGPVRQPAQGGQVVALDDGVGSVSAPRRPRAHRLTVDDAPPGPGIRPASTARSPGRGPPRP